MLRRSMVGALVVSCGLAVAQAPKPAEDFANEGRRALTAYLNNVGSEETAARRKVVAAITTRQQAEARQAEIRGKLLKVIGGLPERTPLNARVTGSTLGDGFRIEKVLYESQPGYYVTALLYVPDVPGKHAAIVVAPGHGPQGKASDYLFSSTFAKNGFVVLDYDPIGQGERLQYPDPVKPDTSLAQRPTGEHGEAGLQPTLVGESLTKFFAWDGIRAVDYLLTRPEVDAQRIGAFGCSGGGTMTALLGALDPRIQATGTACYITSFDALLGSIGPQDSEQSPPGLIAAGFDFPDWVEMVAPKPYAIISTTEDMFPFAGAQQSEAEARKFYGLFGAQEKLEFLTGPGGHGNLRPILGKIVGFFMKNLEQGSEWEHPVLPPVPAAGQRGPSAPPLPKEAFQVTPTGQVLTSYPGAETVHSLTLKRYRAIPTSTAMEGNVSRLDVLRKAVRDVTKADLAHPVGKGGVAPRAKFSAGTVGGASVAVVSERFSGAHCGPMDITVGAPESPGRYPAVLWLTNNASKDESAKELSRSVRTMTQAGIVVLAVTPRPTPMGTEETKSSLLGTFYLTELRSELVGKTLLGMRVDDTLCALDALAGMKQVDPAQITLQASGHLGLVALHAAVLDPRISHVTVDHVLDSYKNLLETPIPVDAPQDMLPGVVLRYDIPDLRRALGARLTWTEPVDGVGK